MKHLIESQRAYYASGVTRDLKFRKAQLKTLRSALEKWEQALLEALWKDLHKGPEEAFLTEFGLLYGEIGEALRHLDRWARRRRKPTPPALFPSRTFLMREPMGCALIIAPWNYPVQLLLSPLIGAIAAGCTAILKPSPYVPEVSAVLQKMVDETFEKRYVALVQGNREVNTALLSHRFDVVFFTGSPALGKVVMAAQSKYLTRLVLELGGKSPCIVDRDADLRVAARRIAWGKCLNSGQTCIAPDYLFLHEDIKDAFIDAFRQELAGLYPEGTATSPYYVHVVRDKAFERVRGYLNDGTVVAGGHFDASARWIEPTLLDGVSPDAPVMQEEIFGPVFPILTFRGREEVVSFINGREKPLAFYYFGRRKDGMDMLARTTSGGACINDVIMHVANGKVPFGGVGNSGMGSYHGERSFLAFSHERSVLVTPTFPDLKFRYMPYRLFALARRMLKG